MHEFAIIAKYFRPLTQDAQGALGLQDDGALLDVPAGQELVVTTDAVVAGVHFLDSLSPQDIAHKVVGVNLSDLAAMGAMPHAVFLAAQFPKDITEDWIAAFAQGLDEALAPSGAVLMGGDTVATPGPLAFTLTALGHVPHGHAMRRSGAKLGDIVLVTGTIGDAALGLKVLFQDLEVQDDEARGHLVRRYARPEPKWRLAAELARSGLVNAAADISDGLAADAGHIGAASGVCLELAEDAVPLSAAAQTVVDLNPTMGETILTGGDDYELLICAAPGAVEKLQDMAAQSGERLTVIGRVVEKNPELPNTVSVLNGDGYEIVLKFTGYQHL